jgi:hypothetical protein
MPDQRAIPPSRSTLPRTLTYPAEPYPELHILSSANFTGSFPETGKAPGKTAYNPDGLIRSEYLNQTGMASPRGKRWESAPGLPGKRRRMTDDFIMPGEIGYEE